MKKIILMLTALLAFSGSAFSQKKTLVAYFSASGVTQRAAEQLAEAAGADLFQITPTQTYTSADLDWRNRESRSSREMRDKKSRPSIQSKVKNMEDYDVVYVGFPIWWNTCPNIINTFLEAYDFSGKTVVPFATSGGSSISKSNQDLKAAYPNLSWKEGRLLNRPSKEELQKWVQSNK